MNSKGHFFISLSKSVIRLFGCLISLYSMTLPPVLICFLIAEILGVLEELVDKR